MFPGVSCQPLQTSCTDLWRVQLSFCHKPSIQTRMRSVGDLAEWVSHWSAYAQTGQLTRLIDCCTGGCKRVGSKHAHGQWRPTAKLQLRGSDLIMVMVMVQAVPTRTYPRTAMAPCHSVR